MRTPRPGKHCPALLIGAVLLAVSSVTTTPAQTRVEFHMLPPVSTGPMDPAWSPDGVWIAFSMRGDIWKVPAEGGEAIALTEGPAYHFEPAWSRDGTRIALTYEIDGDLEIGIVSADGGVVQRVTRSPGYDLQPVWSGDDRSIFFTSRRNRDLDILSASPTTPGNVQQGNLRISEIAGGRGNQFQPAISPAGDFMAYVGPAGGLGSGGIWVKKITLAEAEPPSTAEPTSNLGEPRLVHVEETSYRVEPAWSADGAAIFYSSDAAGSNDIAVVPAAGGNRVRLTEVLSDEFGVAVSPDGLRIAFVSNHEGPTRLYTIPVGGGARSSWREVEITSRRPRTETGVLRGRVLDENGQPTPARIMLVASDGRAYTEDGGFHRMMWINKRHYAHTDGSFEIEVPAGPVSIEAMRGFEYVPAATSADVPAAGSAEVTLSLERLGNLDALFTLGWYSSDMHTHDLHEGRFGLTQEMFFRQLEADDVRVANALIHMDGTKIMGRWDDLTGEPYELSTNDRILYYTQEFRGSYGHVALLGLQRFIMPLLGGARGTPYAPDVLKLAPIDAAYEQGGIAGFVHPYNGPVDTPQRAASADIPVHVALGRGDFFDVVSIASLEMESAEMYYRLLNCGFRLAATGGTDNFSDVWLDPSGGTARTYVHVDGAPPLTFGAWLDAVRDERTFGTNGPLLFLAVGHAVLGAETMVEPGGEIILETADDTTLNVRLAVASIAPLERVEIVVNGAVAHTWEATDFAADRATGAWQLTTSIELPGSGWIAARAVGPPSEYVGDAFPFAQTSPVYVVREGVTHTSVEDARFLLETINVLWDRVDQRDAFNTDAERRDYFDAIEAARAVFQRIIDGG
ncbi:MAG: CehA/McbA family metallohydrolase [Acidobacteria bacterium]|nr:CehA/McbA family metallohydrolase [Acidobacteriota bacterium]